MRLEKRRITLKTIVNICVLAVTVLILFFGMHLRGNLTALTPTAHADDEGIQFTCSLSALHGPYGITTTGWIVGFGPIGPVAEAGVISFDGAGGVSQTTTLSLNGIIVPNRSSLSGTYLVNSDCTGNISLVLPGPAGPIPSTLHFVIVDHGHELRLVNTGAGRVLTSDAKRQ